MSSRLSAALCVAATLSVSPGFAATESPDTLEEVIVTATLRPQSWLATPASVTVLSAAMLSQGGQQHFQDVLGLVPNLNWAGGSSRPRYFQIRGIGEREQYEGAPNPSVGFLVDDIDFSGIGMVATLHDVAQIDVLRGPQGTRLGANALAGLIVVSGNAPTDTWQLGVDASMGDYHSRSVSGMLNAPVASMNSALRLSVQHDQSDGFMHNRYLNRRDTNDRDEATARLKWRWQLSEHTRVDATMLHANFNNGYDAWAIDNSRNTLSDQPGKDAQRANGGSVRLTSDTAPGTLTVIATSLHSRSINSFDADWGNDRSWAPYVYDYFMSSLRQRHNQSLEVRLASPAATPESMGWLLGAYAQHTRETGRDDLWGRYADPGDPVFVDRDALDSDYRADNTAVFAQLDGYLGSVWRWSAGLRGEQRQARYRDRDEVTLDQNNLSARDGMAGGQLSLLRELTPQSNTYVSLARGYKAGGFNLGASITREKRYFAPESLWSIEWGYKQQSRDQRLSLDLNVFYQWRRDLQMSTGVQADPSNPATYVFLTSNAARGYNTGVEASLQYQLSNPWRVGGSLGLLRTRVSGARDDTGLLVPEREQAHAPEYTAAVFASWQSASGLFARVDVQAKDNFYFDVPTDHNQQSHAYSVTNLSAGYAWADWRVTGWVNNVFDRDYAVRGFFFSNEPPAWQPKLYTQKGDPRTLGLKVHWQFQ